jgi:menaquinone-dependent protoporphyrinogen oxidase
VIAMTAPRVLVAYGSKNGATAELADWIGEDLAGQGVDAEVRPAAEVGDLRLYDAVVLGSAVYVGRWRHEALGFARRHRKALVRMPVWLFTSGPLDPSAAEREIPPVPSAARVAARTDAVDHVTFGGRLIPGARGFIARRILSGHMGGDFRDRRQIDAWALGVADAVTSERQPG